MDGNGKNLIHDDNIELDKCQIKCSKRKILMIMDYLINTE